MLSGQSIYRRLFVTSLMIFRFCGRGRAVERKALLWNGKAICDRLLARKISQFPIAFGSDGQDKEPEDENEDEDEVLCTMSRISIEYGILCYVGQIISCLLEGRECGRVRRVPL